MDASPPPVRYSAYSWSSLIKAISKSECAIRLPLLETILFDPSTSNIDLWLTSDSHGLLKPIDKSTLLKADLLSACMRTILTAAEQNLYASEVQSLINASDSMVSWDSAIQVPI